MLYIFFIQALRIHISLEMKKALDAVGGFKIEHRGLVDVKVIFLLSLYYKNLYIMYIIIYINLSSIDMFLSLVYYPHISCRKNDTKVQTGKFFINQ